MLYTVKDFLIEQKEQIEKLEKQLEEIPNEDRKALIKSQIAIYFKQGLEALTRFEHDCPKPIRDYFLGYREDPPGFIELKGGGEYPPDVCPRCNCDIKEIPAGISKRTGYSYDKFWVCNNPACDFTFNYRKPRKTKRQRDSDLADISLTIAVVILVILAFFGL